VAENTRVPLNRIERVLAFVVATIAGVSILAIVAIFIGRATHVNFASGVWPTVALLPGIGLPFALVGLIVFLIVTTVRRTRLARDAGK
jgi:uncharacterized integral membrane protein